MPYLKVVAIAVFAAIVVAKLVYIVVKTARIVLQIEPPMAGFDSEIAAEPPVPEVRPVYRAADEGDLVPLSGLELPVCGVRGQ